MEIRVNNSSKVTATTTIKRLNEPSRYVTGVLRINQKNYKESYINNPDGGPDICINGIESRGNALEGDFVKISLNHYRDWKVDFNKVANKWDHYKDDLWPIIEEVKELKNKQNGNHPLNKSLSSPVSPLSDQNPDSNNSTPDNNCNNNNNKGNNNHYNNRRINDDIDTQNKTRSERKKRNVQINNATNSNRNSHNNSGSNSSNNNTKDDKKPKSKVPSNLPSEICNLQYSRIHGLSIASELAIKTGCVVEILKRNHTGLAGGYLAGKYNEDLALFKPTDHRVPRMTIPLSECPHDFEHSPRRYKDILFIARMIGWSGGHDLAQGQLIKTIGQGNKLENQMEALLLEHQIYDVEFPGDVEKELQYLDHLQENWFRENSKGRRDLTNECILTIDPKTARDLDDAVHIKQIAEQIYEVGVHIADVSYFVQEMSAVDYYARQRTTSVYLVDRVIPMLPRVLCERMCSLNPGEPKLTFSVIWKMDKYGRIIDEWFGRTIIKTSAKLAYEEAQDIIDNPNDVNWIIEGENMPKLYSHDWRYVFRSVTLLNKIARKLRAKRFGDGALKIEQTKIKFELDKESGTPTGFSFEKRSEANYLIEEYMLLANMAVAKRIYEFNKELAFLRRHPPSSIRLLNEIKDFCDAKGVHLDIDSSGGIQKSLNFIKNPTMSKVVSLLLLRSMQPAEYICTGALSPTDPYGYDHFALNVPLYTHFTSPIRRYPDIIVHRMLGLALGYEKSSNEELESLSLMADLCTKRKISSKLISDVSQKWYFNLFVLNAGYCELLACVTKIFDMSFDVILVDYDRTGRVYLDKLKPNLANYEYQSIHGIKRLVLDWNVTNNDGNGEVGRKLERSKRKQRRRAELLKVNETQNQLESRTSLETRKSFPSSNLESQVNFADDQGKQIIEVFDIVKVVVTADPNDITVLNIHLKVPEGQIQPTVVKSKK